MAEQAINIPDRCASEKKGMLSSSEGREVLSLNEYEANAGKHDEVMKKAYRLRELAKQIGEHSAAVPKPEQRMEALVLWRSFDLPLDFKGTKKTATFTGSIQDEIILKQVTGQLRELALQTETIDVAIASAPKEQACLFIICTRPDVGVMEDAFKKMNLVKPPLNQTVSAKCQQQLEEELTEEKAEIKKAEKTVAEMISGRELIRFVMDYYTMRAEKYGMLNGLAQSRHVLSIAGHIPKNAAAKPEKLLQEKYEVVVEYTEPSDEGNVPILLHDNKFTEPVEGVIESYSVPSKEETNPSMIAALSYCVQFGLMLSDAAYSLIMVADITYCLTKFKNMEARTEKFMRMFMYCGISITFWGFMLDSLFEDTINVIATIFFNRPDIGLVPPWFEPTSLPIKLLVFAFELNILHLLIGLGIKSYSCMRSGSLANGIYDVISWYMLVGGGIIYLLTMSMFTEMLGLAFTLPAAAGTIAAYAAAISLVGTVLTSGRESKSWVKGILKGLYGAYGVGSYLSDILFYSRLLALGLATGVISTVFNKTGSMMDASIPRAIIFVLVFVIEHSPNLAVNALGTYVHINRLQYVKFLGKFYEDGRRKLGSFAIRTKYCKIREDIQ